MPRLIPPAIVPTVSVNIPQSNQPIELLSVDIESMQSIDNSSELLPVDSVLSDLPSEIIYVKEPEKPSFNVAAILADSNDSLTYVDTNEIVETIIASPENINIETEQYHNVNNIDDGVINNVTKNTSTEIIENVVSEIANDNDIVQDVVENVSGEVVQVGGVSNNARSRSRSNSLQLLPQLTRFHRISAIRVERGISLSRAAKRLNLDIAEAREQENEATDLRLSQLYNWRDILDVSVGELIFEPEEIPTNPVKNRCQLVKLMKTVRSIIIESKSEVILILARQLESQLIELMPELAAIAAWPSLGQSRNTHSPGAAITRCQGFGNIYLRRNTTIKNNNND